MQKGFDQHLVQASPSCGEAKSQLNFTAMSAFSQSPLVREEALRTSGGATQHTCYALDDDRRRWYGHGGHWLGNGRIA